MLLKRRWFPLLFSGIFASSFLALYFFKVENGGNPNFENASCKQPTILSKENGESHFLSPAEEFFKLYDGVETLVLFIGYQRSCHSLVGAILDAHPEIIIPSEFDLMTRWKKYQAPELIQNNLQKYALFYDLHRLSMKQAMFGIRANFKNHSNTKSTGELATKYTYHVPGLWQGGYHKRIKVIGDKKGGVTSSILMGPRSMSELEELSKLVQVPIKFIHVTRNPFDNIASMTLLKACSRNAAKEFQAGEKVNRQNYLERSIEQYFELAASNQRVRETYGDAVFDVPGHETVLRPKETLQRLCDHLGVTCSEDYFEKCSKVMHGTPSVTRNKVVWTDEQIKRVREMMEGYPFLRIYSFDKYPS